MIMKFLTDSMLGRLTRFLRIFGYDTIYANDLEEYFNLTPVPDDKLMIYAKENDRIVITKDLAFHKRVVDQSTLTRSLTPHKRFMDQCIYLQGNGIYDYIQQLKDEIGLEFNFKMIIARCSICNSTLKPIDKALIENEVKSETYKHYDDFFQWVSFFSYFFPINWIFSSGNNFGICHSNFLFTNFILAVDFKS